MVNNYFGHKCVMHMNFNEITNTFSNISFVSNFIDQFRILLQVEREEQNRQSKNRN